MFFGGDYSLFPILFTLTFLLILGFFLVTLIRNIAQWNNNNHAPRLTVCATIVAKRTQVRHHGNANATGAPHSSTHYYATFQVESGDRLELLIPTSQFGYLVEGDQGQLTFQGTRFLGFQRTAFTGGTPHDL